MFIAISAVNLSFYCPYSSTWLSNSFSLGIPSRFHRRRITNPSPGKSPGISCAEIRPDNWPTPDPDPGPGSRSPWRSTRAWTRTPRASSKWCPCRSTWRPRFGPRRCACYSGEPRDTEADRRNKRPASPTSTSDRRSPRCKRRITAFAAFGSNSSRLFSEPRVIWACARPWVPVCSADPLRWARLGIRWPLCTCWRSSSRRSPKIPPFHRRRPRWCPHSAPESTSTTRVSFHPRRSNKHRLDLWKSKRRNSRWKPSRIWVCRLNPVTGAGGNRRCGGTASKTVREDKPTKGNRAGGRFGDTPIRNWVPWCKSVRKAKSVPTILLNAVTVLKESIND